MALRVIGIDHGSKENLVKDCGAEVFLDITKFDDTTLPEEVKKVTGGLGASAVIVCTASNGAYAQALNFLRFGGTLVCVGMPEGESKPIANAYPAEMVGISAPNDRFIGFTRLMKLSRLTFPRKIGSE